LRRGKTKEGDTRAKEERQKGRKGGELECSVGILLIGTNSPATPVCGVGNGSHAEEEKNRNHYGGITEFRKREGWHKA